MASSGTKASRECASRDEEKDRRAVVRARGSIPGGRRFRERPRSGC